MVETVWVQMLGIGYWEKTDTETDFETEGRETETEKLQMMRIT